MAELIAYPNGVDESISSYASVDSAYPFSNVFGKGHENTTFTRWYMITGFAGITPVFFTFDLSAIPIDATIDNVSVTAKGRMQDSSSIRAGNNTIALCNLNSVVVMSEDTTLFGTSAGTATVSTTEFTRETLDNLRFRFQGTRGILNSSSQYYMEFYGCTLTVEYTTVAGDKFMLKTNGVWGEHTEIYKKKNGLWELQSDIQQAIDTNMKYK